MAPRNSHRPLNRDLDIIDEQPPLGISQKLADSFDTKSEAANASISSLQSLNGSADSLDISSISPKVHKTTSDLHLEQHRIEAFLRDEDSVPGFAKRDLGLSREPDAQWIIESVEHKLAFGLRSDLSAKQAYINSFVPDEGVEPIAAYPARVPVPGENLPWHLATGRQTPQPPRRNLSIHPQSNASNRAARATSRRKARTRATRPSASMPLPPPQPDYIQHSPGLEAPQTIHMPSTILRNHSSQAVQQDTVTSDRNQERTIEPYNTDQGQPLQQAGRYIAPASQRLSSPTYINPHENPASFNFLTSHVRYPYSPLPPALGATGSNTRHHSRNIVHQDLHTSNYSSLPTDSSGSTGDTWSTDSPLPPAYPPPSTSFYQEWSYPSQLAEAEEEMSDYYDHLCDDELAESRDL